MLRAVACGALLPEAVLWSLLVQLTAALRAIHTAGLACRYSIIAKIIILALNLSDSILRSRLVAQGLPSQFYQDLAEYKFSHGAKNIIPRLV